MMWPYAGQANEGNILMRSEEKEKWFLLDIKAIIELEKVVDVPRELRSVCAHICRNFSSNDAQLLGIDDSVAGYCWWCKDKIPGDVRGLWMLHNFDLASDVSRETIDSLKDAATGGQCVTYEDVTRRSKDE